MTALASTRIASAVTHEGRHAMTSVLHVATAGSDTADGSEDSPFRTISRAAAIAQPGDTVLVHGGEYREWVAPRRGGLSDQRRITYEAAAGEHVVIKGSEVVTGWEPVRRDRVEGSRSQLAVRRLQPVLRGDRRRLDRLPREAVAAKAPRRRVSQRAELLRGAEPRGGVGSAAADGGPRRLDGDD